MYQALYRKWRPQVFADVVGQDHITTTLMNEIKTGRHSHAYLFTGSRGTGKTTCAKIFAKAVNCEHPVNGDPCGECETCKGIDSGSVMDVIEIDAASNNGVDNIRDIRDEANFTPVGGKYRVYIIDEVHMLSTGAFNALLKTLEEPPEHVKFILATTEVHKLPATILSRCQRFDFKRITPEDIAGRLAYVAEKEDLTLDADAAMLIARLADGALRDALSIMDQCIGHSRNITVDVVNETTGLAGKDYLFSLSDAILRMDSATALEKINELHNRSCDMERLCNELTNHFRNLMICRAVNNPKDLIVCSLQDLTEYMNSAKQYSMDRILEVLNLLGDTVTNLRKGLNRRVEMEIAVIKLCGNEVQPQASGIQHSRNAVVPPPAEQPKVAASAVEIPAAKAPTNESPTVKDPVTERSGTEGSGIENSSVEFSSVESISADTAGVQSSGFEASADEATNFKVSSLEVSADEATSVQVSGFKDSADEAASVKAPVKAEQPQEVQSSPVMPDDSIDNYVSLEKTVQDGPIPTNIWNALVREVVNTDKALIGTMNSAKAYKKGSSLLILTDNMLLKRFVPLEPHKENIYNATFTVFGEYLNPSITEEEPEGFSEAMTSSLPEKENGFTANERALSESESNLTANESFSTEDTLTRDADPLDAFINNIKNDEQIDFSLFIEE